MNTDLSQKVLDRCDKDKLPADHPLRVKAIKFTEKATGYLSPEKTATVLELVSSWARLRTEWKKYSGEDLLGGLPVLGGPGSVKR